MATRLSDAIIPTVYGTYTAVNSPETSAFFQSGIITSNDFLNQIARVGGKTVTVPFWQDIDATIEPNYSNDDPADKAVANKISSGTMSARKVWLNQGFSEMDLVPELAGSSPMQHIKNRFGTYWTRQMERRIIATAVGVLTDNVTNGGGDMLIDISALTGAAAVFNSGTFIDAAYTMGDQSEAITAIAVHSAVEARMVKNDEITTVRTSQGEFVMRTYRGRAVIVDDNLPFTGTGAARVFTSILFGSGAIGFGGVEGHAFAFGEGVPKVAAEVYRTPQAGHGGGMEELWERKTWMIHPFGYQYNEGVITEFSPTLANLRDGTHFSRVVVRKNVPMAFVKSLA